MWITEIVIDFPPRFHFRMWKEGEADRGGGDVHIPVRMLLLLLLLLKCSLMSLHHHHRRRRRRRLGRRRVESCSALPELICIN